MTEGIPVVRMYTDSSGHTRFAKMQIPVKIKTGLGSVGMFSSLLVNQNLEDNTGDLKTQFAVTPIPDNLEGEGPKLAHTAPRKQLVLTLSGCLEFKSCGVASEDLEHKVVIRRGDILLAEDLEGAGHVWQFVESSDGNLYPWVRCYIHLGEEYEHFVSQLVP
ncbi:uncharacterized protein METZ01_LOCUS160565 [marine metagenome]|uniref:Uncharacterized protein n=1 Tax=marine metagenome TaxID=408172 RepID=A0A382B2G3_9ZZZZ